VFVDDGVLKASGEKETDEMMAFDVCLSFPRLKQMCGQLQKGLS
jgi:hypothetical protein